MRIAMIASLVGIPAVAHAEPDTADARVTANSNDGAAGDIDLRLTLSSFLFRESGDAAGALVDGGATVDSASPVRRYFGDLRLEMSGDGLEFDGRVRQTTSERYQSGADGGSEYELRTLAYRTGTANNKLIVGRQFVDAVGSTKIDGAAFVRRITKTWSGTLFGGAFPALGSRSLDTDYPAIQKPDGSTGSPLFPLTGGLGIGYDTPDVHGDIGVAAVYVAQDVPTGIDTNDSERSRVFTTASGYARPTSWIDVYHFALLDLVGGGDGGGSRVNLTNGSLGIAVHPTPALQVSGAVNHVSTDLFQIAARNTLEDPDPNASGLVQNNVELIRVSSDSVRGGTSLALARSRFQLSLSGAYHRRPAVDVALTDGGKVTFRDARAVDTTLTVLDRHSLAGLRASLSGTMTFPLDTDTPNRARSTVVRVAASRAMLDDRLDVTADASAARFRNANDPANCMESLDVLACYSTSKTSALEAGLLGSYQIAREWLVLVDSHVGVRDVVASSLMGTVDYPRVLSFTVFARAQWRYR